MRAWAFAVALGAVMSAMDGGSAWAINKCVGVNGKVVFQDLPCAGRGEQIKVRPASGAAPATTAPVSADPNAAPAADATRAATPGGKTSNEGAFGDTWRRRYELEHGIPRVQRQLESHRVQCRAKIEALRAQQSSANNNLAGATYLQSLATEMQATATMCDMQAREMQANLTKMQGELAALDAQKP